MSALKRGFKFSIVIYDANIQKISMSACNTIVNQIFCVVNKHAEAPTLHENKKENGDVKNIWLLYEWICLRKWLGSPLDDWKDEKIDKFIYSISSNTDLE